MKKILLTISTLAISFYLLTGQTLFNENDFEYFSETDRDYLQSYFQDPNKSLAYLGVFFSSSIDEQKTTYNKAKLSIESTINDIRNSKYYKKGGKKLIDHIFKKVHDSYFDKYNEDTYFSDIFIKREYNCATASALYALIFYELSIPFEVNYSENHIYLIAYPFTSPIMVETTNPLYGSLSYTKPFMENYVTYLRKSKIISQREYESNSVEILFREYFFKTTKGNIKAAAGILFLNQTALLINRKEYYKAIQMGIRSSFFLDGLDKSNYLVIFASDVFLKQDNYSSPKSYKVLSMLTAFSDDFISMEEYWNLIGGNFKNFSIKGDKEQLINSYKSFTSSLKDTSLLSVIKYLYFKETGRFYLFTNEGKKAVSYIDSALTIKPDDQELEYLLINSLGISLNELEYPDSAYYLLQNYFTRFPNLNINSFAQNFKSTVLLLNVEYYFKNNIQVKGEEFFAVFQQEYPPESIKYISTDIFERALGETAIYYFKKGQLKKAKEKATIGLMYFPNSYYIRRINSSLEN